MLTTRTAIPSARTTAAALSASSTSLPVPTIITSASGSSLSTYAPRRTPSYTRSRGRSSVVSGWRHSTSPVGPDCSSATSHAAAVSFASAGLMIVRPGIARRLARCSIGWWVGPSGPRETESCVQRNSAGKPIRAASRIAGRSKSENTKKVPPKGRSPPANNIPFIAAPIACSRTPQ